MSLQILYGEIGVTRVDAIIKVLTSTDEDNGVGINGCTVGTVKCTKACDLPFQYVIQAVAPIWQGGTNGEWEQLSSCYWTSLELALEQGCETVAISPFAIFPCPSMQMYRAAADTIRAFLSEHEISIYLAICDKDSYRIDERLFNDVSAYIAANYKDVYPGLPLVDYLGTLIGSVLPSIYLATSDTKARNSKPSAKPNPPLSTSTSVPRFPGIDANLLAEALRVLDESFSEMLLRKIDEAGITDAECYKKANIDRKLFSKIRSDRGYKPSKSTALAFAIALELPLNEVKEMLMKAGYALSRSNKADIIVEYYIMRGHYDIYDINETLFAFDQALLGGR